ncbi:MAG TPA: hypothetical protein VHU83_04060 [Bryobacteraceae bacterium]|jgi:hypothetical protein|nr:hypothetical protein [Bryobacteraceae bacterium]
MGESVLAVPIHLDALYVKEPSRVAAPMADFTRLPFFDGDRDVNPQAAWLGETAARRPFTDDAFDLKKGIHLHWRFPKGLSTGIQLADGRIQFPHLPDRWIVTRGRDTNGTRTIEERWVVDSSYLHPEEAVTESAAYPLNVETTGRCYRYMGRALPVDQWLKATHHPLDYLDAPLTVAGYGEPTFASFYPNCSQQFGFHDPHYAEQIPTGLYYQVVGWYRDPRQDWLQYLLNQPFEQQAGDGSRTPHVNYYTELDRLGRILKDRLQWSIEDRPTLDVVIACHGSLAFRPGNDLAWEPSFQKPTVTFGATITEALSAYLASEVASGNAAQKDLIEDQLEAIMLDRTLSARSIDVAAKFKEARHEKGFDEVYAGILWTIRTQTSATEKPAPDINAEAWPDVAEQLAELNKLQKAYHLAWDEIRSLRRRLYSDWCRYMRAMYPANSPGAPAIFELRTIVEQQLGVIDQKVAEAGILDLSPRSPDIPPAFSETKPGSLARRIVDAFSTVLASLRAHEGRLKEPVHFLIQPAVAPRYWRPVEPVVLLTGEAARISEPFHVEDAEADGLLRCQVLHGLKDVEQIFKINPSQVLSRFPYRPRVWTGQPWHPLLLEWEVELTPFLRLANLTTPDRNYDPKFLTRNFMLKREDADLSPRAIAGELDAGQSFVPAPGSLVYAGSSLLTPHVADQFVFQLYRFLERLMKELPPPPDSILSGGDDLDNSGKFGSRATVEYLVGQLQKNPPPGLDAVTVGRLGEVLKRLQQSNVFCVAQRLSGFHEALLMHQQILRIPVRSPIGFEEERTLASKVEAAIGREAPDAPIAEKAFNPIRAGELQVKRLRLISTFGRQLDFASERVITATPMDARSKRAASIFLPPRLTQASRLEFRWLAAANEEHEMNSHPDSSPICGWVIANHLDSSLFFYSAGGAVLGYMEVEANARVRWHPAPGAVEPILQLDQIKNDFLRRLVKFFVGGSAKYFHQFLTDLEAAQQRIEPEHAGDPLPMGQPLALVRARLNLELQGLPAVQRNWADPRGSKSIRGSEDVRFTSVRFPIRLGEQDQLNDGLTVYWVENPDASYKDDAYVIPNYDDAASPAEKKCDFLYQSIEDAPLKLSMLIDPRGVVHAATGILPAKSIQIPPHQFADAMKRFEIAFLSAPVLAGMRPESGEDRIALPVSDPPGYQWSWLEKAGTGWTSASIQAADLFRPFAGATEIREGWLKLELKKEKDVKKQ